MGTPSLVYKFGGAALSTATAMRNALRIARQRPADASLIVVVSALGKTTNTLEAALQCALAEPGAMRQALDPIQQLHDSLAREMLSPESPGREAVRQRLSELQLLLAHLPSQDYETLYDMVIPYGEMLSSLVMLHALREGVGPAQWVDARTVLRSDSVHRSATVLTHPSATLCRQTFAPHPGALYVTQGFIASSMGGETTTLGREGSDYTAALIGQFVEAQSVTIWKDVPGFLTADPSLFPHAAQIETLDYREAIEMAYAGAKVVHPKAIKPLQNAGIPLRIRPYAAPESAGTTITNLPGAARSLPPLIALRERQAILSISPTDLSFAVQDALADIFNRLKAHHIQINLVQTSALILSLCVDEDAVRLPKALKSLEDTYRVTFNTELILVAIRHHTEALRSLFAEGEGIIASQTTRATAQYVMPTPTWQQRYYPAVLEAMARKASH